MWQVPYFCLSFELCLSQLLGGCIRMLYVGCAVHNVHSALQKTIGLLRTNARLPWARTKRKADSHRLTGSRKEPLFRGGPEPKTADTCHFRVARHSFGLSRGKSRRTCCQFSHPQSVIKCTYFSMETISGETLSRGGGPVNRVVAGHTLVQFEMLISLSGAKRPTGSRTMATSATCHVRVRATAT